MGAGVEFAARAVSALVPQYINSVTASIADAGANRFMTGDNSNNRQASS
jgi:hypothetical protein